jgi:hypothetical protein
MLNATGGTKIAALSAVAAFQDAGAEAFYVNTLQQCIQWLLPADRPPIALDKRISLDTYLGVHGVRVAGDTAGGSAEARKPLSAELARNAARGREVMQYFRKLFYAVETDHQTIDAALAAGADSFPPDPGPVSRALLRRLAAEGMVILDAGEQVVGVRSASDLGYLGGGRWLEEYTYVTVRDAGADEVRANLQVRWGAPTTVENEIDVAAVHANRLYLFSCKTGGVVASARKDDIGQDEIFKLEALRELAGGTYGRAVLVAGSPLTDRLKSRCARLGIGYVDANDLHRLGEHVRRLMGV